MKRIQAFIAVVWLVLASSALAGDRFPGQTWLMYASPEDAGFSSEKLARAQEYWESLPSAAAMVVCDGAVVAAWGDVERRFLLHSARKSLMSGLYGIHVDAGNIDLEKTMQELVIDDTNPPLNAEEKQAKIIDLLRARSGVYHPAAAEPAQNPKPPRGSHKPGTHWCYNNWDFNALGTIIEQEAGIKIFEEFKERFADPLGMQDYLARHGLYQREPGKSIHPAYHFRMSARDMARFGLLYLNKGSWKGKQILSQEWIRQSTRAHSDDAWFSCGYGYMWWVYREAPFGELGMFSALGVGEQSIDVIPGADMVFVLRTNTYVGDSVGHKERLELIRMLLEARTSAATKDAKLVALPAVPTEWQPIRLDDEQKRRLCGEVMLPPPMRARCEISLDQGDLVLAGPMGTFGLIAVSPNRFILEDLEQELVFELNDQGSVARIITEESLNARGYRLLERGRTDKAIEAFKKAVTYFPNSFNAYDSLAEAYMASGNRELAISNYEKSLALNPENTNAVEMLKRCRAAESTGGKESGFAEEVELPDTLAGRCAAAFIDMFNSGDDVQIRAFEGKYRSKSTLAKRSIEDRLEQYHQLRTKWRRLTPLRIVQSSDRQITLLIRASGTDEGLAARFGLEDEPPHGLEKASFRGPLSTKANDAAVLRALD